MSTIDANRAVDLVQRKKTFNMVEWCPTGFKIGINRSEPGYIEDGDLARTNRSLTLISNSTAVQQVFGRICQRFDALYERRAFMKHYILSRTEEMDMSLAREDLNTLHEFYDEVKAEKSKHRSNRISYIPPTASDQEKQASEQQIDQVFENRRSALRKSVMIG